MNCAAVPSGMNCAANTRRNIDLSSPQPDSITSSIIAASFRCAAVFARVLRPSANAP